ncbi:MAG TPA: hypothetical protein VGI39_33750 [Polyangiaceae bacterium]|jgi:hypothetical protein
MLDSRFARAHFVADGDAQERCQALAEVLTSRLVAATNVPQAIEWVLADLRALGHEVARWDEVISDAWAKPENDHYLWVVLEAASSDDDEANDAAPPRSVYVAFRPRLRDLPRRCPQCFAEMTACDIRLRVQGHGSASAPALRVRFEAPGIPELDALVGPTSLEVARSGMLCPSCHSAWFPPPRS